MSRSDRLEALAWLAGGIAHDFNNHLQGIMSAFSILKNSGAIPANLKEVITLGESGGNASTALSNKLLTFSHGGTPLRKPVTFDKIISAAWGGVTPPEGIECSISLSSDLPPVFADHLQMEQVIRNLLRNSFTAMPDGGTLSISGMKRHFSSMEGSDVSPGDYVEIVISDSGIGMSSEVCHKAFDPFFSTRPDGAGLGLAVVYSVIRRHDGKISISSTPGNGCRVTLLLPVSPRTTEKTLRISASPHTGTGVILIMDDDIVVGKMLKMLLKMAGYDSIIAKTGEEALCLYKDSLSKDIQYVGVITDLTTSQGMNGVALAQALLELNPACRIIVSSGYSHDPVMAHYKDHGFVGVLKKPYTIEELKNVLDGVMV